MTASPLISKCSALWNSEKGTQGGSSLAYKKGAEKGPRAQEPHSALLSVIM